MFRRRTIILTLLASLLAALTGWALPVQQSQAASCVYRHIQWPVKSSGYHEAYWHHCGTYRDANGKLRIDLRDVTTRRIAGPLAVGGMEINGWYQTSGYRWWHPKDSSDGDSYWHTDNAPNPVYGERASLEFCIDVDLASPEGCGEGLVWG